MKYLITLLFCLVLFSCEERKNAGNTPLDYQEGAAITTLQIVEAQDSATYTVVGNDVYILQDNVVILQAKLERKANSLVNVEDTMILIIVIALAFNFIGFVFGANF